MFELKQVTTPAAIAEFHAVASLVYQNDPQYIQPLTADIEEIFDRSKNEAYNGGDAIRWVLTENGKLLGRVAAFYQTKNSGEKMGGMGFFDCVKRKEVAFALFDQAQNWLKVQGLGYMDGPVNFGDRDSFWGLLVEMKSYSSYREAYHPAYYRAFFEEYGFEKIIEQKTCDISEKEFNFERVSKLAGRVMANSKYHFKTLDYGKIEQFADDFMRIYNEAWAHHEDFRPLTREKMLQRLKKVKPVMPGEFVIFAYSEDRPIGFYINILEVNQVFKYFGGKLSAWNMLRFLWMRGKINKLRGIVFGVVPDFQNLGIETGLIMEFYKKVKANPRIEKAELAWIGDFNAKMLSMLESLGAYTTKVHYTYRKNF